jgi:hypothetical protein
MTETDELRARIVRLELEIANRQAPAAAPVKARGGGVLNFIGSLILIGLCIFGMYALLVVFLPDFAGTPETVYSTPAALPSARVVPGGAPQGYVLPTPRIVEATFPPPTPQVIPTDIPASPPPIYAPVSVVTEPNTEPAEHTAFTCGVEPGNDPNADCAPPEDDPGAKVYSLEGRTFAPADLPTSGPSSNPGGFDAASEPGNQPTPVR